MSNVFRAFPALRSMGENVANYIRGQFSSEKEEERLFNPIFDSWTKPELAGSENSLLGNLLLEGGFGYQKSNTTLQDLAIEGVLNRTLLEMLEDEVLLEKPQYTVHPNRRPYTHQEDAYRATLDGKSILVSAGTGSGKTECFLYPIISDILKETPEQRQQRGVRAIILYPTNALIHSQEERLVEYLNTEANAHLAGRPISFCMYNSGLEASGRQSSFYKVNNRRDLRDDNGMPDIILTNFSMLEYILLRGDDFGILQHAGRSLIGDNRQRTVFRHLVLDEAHTYTGANATEIALQIRRVMLAMEDAGGRMPTVQFYATSATFSGDDEGLRRFAKGLFFNVNDEEIEIIKGNRFAAPVPFNNNLEVPLDENLCQKLLGLNRPKVELAEVYRALEIEESPESLAEFLWRVEVVREIRAWLCDTSEEKSFLFEDLYNRIHEHCENVSKEILAMLLDIGSLARFTPDGDDESIPLLPTRWHSVFRKFEGLYACVNPNCNAEKCQEHSYRGKFGKLYTTWREKCECGAPVFPISFCKKCGKPYIMVQDGNRTPAIRNIIGAFFDISEDSDAGQGVEFLSIDDNENPGYDYFDNKFYRQTQCSCGRLRETSEKHWSQNFSQNKPLFTSLVLEGVWPHLPTPTNENGEFWPSEGRHILTFSDTRQNAAQLAPIMEETSFRNTVYQLVNESLKPQLTAEQNGQIQILETMHQNGVLNDAIYNVQRNAIFAAIAPRSLSVRAIEEHMERAHLFERLGLREGEPDEEKIRIYIRYMLLNLPPHSISLENAGVIECVYPGLDQQTVPDEYRDYLNDEEWKSLLYLCLQSMRQRQAFAFLGNNTTKDFFEDYFDFHNKNDNRNNEVKILSRDIKENLIPLIFGDVAQAILDEPRNRDCRLEETIKDIFINNGWINQKKQIVWDDHNGANFHPIQFQLRKSPLFTCNKTNQLVFKNIRGFSPYDVENGISEVEEGTRYPWVHSVLNREGMFICIAREHTAQMDVKNNQEIERQFRENWINLLSSTTTMEMGIDVGALASVMLANTPPTQANYMQRAGRAGRRGEGSTLIFTICNASPHDEMFYNSPEWAFKKNLASPEISFRSRVLLQRAVNAWLTRILVRTMNMRHNNNNPMWVYDTFGGFFRELNENRCLEWRDNEESLLHQVFSNPDHVMRTQINMLLSGAQYPENFDFLDEQTSYIGNSIHQLKKLIEDWTQKLSSLNEELNQYEERMRAARANNNDDERNLNRIAVALRRECNRLNPRNINDADNLKDSTIGYLVEHQFFPSHGLPLDITSLIVMKKERGAQYYTENEKYKLQRNRTAALRSYAPGNETVVWDKRFKSLGIQLDYRQRFGIDIDENRQNNCIKKVYYCPKCQTIFTERPIDGICSNGCRNAQDEPQNVFERNVIAPETFVTKEKRGEGFKYGVKNPERMAYLITSQIDGLFDESNPHNRFVSLHQASSCTVHFFNEGFGRGFKYCKNCFRVLDTSADDATDHIAPSKEICTRHYWSESFYLYHHIVTEAVKVKIKDDFLTSPNSIGADPKAANALGIALKSASCILLAIEEKEIDFCLPEMNQIRDCDVILYDTNKGGSGIIPLIAQRMDEILQYAIKFILIGSDEHDATCNGACPKCLISYSTQFLFSREETSPDRLVLLRKIKKDILLENEHYETFNQWLTENRYERMQQNEIESVAQANENVCIAIPYLSSDLLNTTLWYKLRTRLNTNGVKFIVPREIQDDNEIIVAKEICRRIGENAIQIGVAEPGIYASNQLYQLRNWNNREVLSPFENGTEEYRVWTASPAEAPFGTTWGIPHNVNSFCGEDEADVSRRELDDLMQLFINNAHIADSGIDFSQAESWIYADNYALTDSGTERTFKSKMKDAFKSFIRLIGAGHLLQNRNAGTIKYSREKMRDYRGARISWADIVVDDNVVIEENNHDRFLRVNLSDGRCFTLTIGQGLDAFGTERGRYVKKAGAYGWMVK